MSFFDTRCPFHVFVAGVAATTVVLTLSRLFKNKPSIQRFGVEGRYSNAIVYCNTVYTSGQVGEGSTIKEQTLSALADVDKALAEAGSDKSKIVEVTVWLADMSDYDAMNEVYDKWIIPGSPPCRACVQAQLYSPSCKVEVRVVAAL